ncbi:MAG: HepT-like ribonuclease domain-containing protein [Methanolobus sp.]
MREYRLFLTDIIETIDEIEEFTSGMDFTKFLNARKNWKSVVKNIEIIGEAAKNVPDEIKENYPDIFVASDCRYARIA